MDHPITTTKHPPAKFLKHLQDAIIQFFGPLCGASFVACNGRSTEDPASPVVSVISLVGDVNWVFALVLTKATAELVTEKFSGFKISYDSLDMKDIVGEMSNIIGGDLVARLDREGIKAQLSLPTVLRGKSLRLANPEDLASAILCFQSSQGEFWAQLSWPKELSNEK
ncbi:MAG: chemotaxis protein CheX [Elusimicrobiota bacterium]|jgi:CheY-specific phosphatase CheX